MPKSKKKTRKEPGGGSSTQVLQTPVKPSKKRLRIQSSEEEDAPSIPDSPAKSPGAAASLLPSSRPGTSFGRKTKKEEKGEKSKQDIEVRKIKQKLFRNNLEKKKLEEQMGNAQDPSSMLKGLFGLPTGNEDDSDEDEPKQKSIKRK